MSNFISLPTAEAMTGKYRSNRNAIVKTEYGSDDLLPICETFTKDDFDVILSTSGCASVRIYYGMSEDLKVHAIIVPVDADGADILPGSSLTEADDEGILENGNRCPDLCPPPSPLNE
jgi:hypothetical protein